MIDPEIIIEGINDLCKKDYTYKSRYLYPLQIFSLDEKEILSVIDSLLRGELSMGRKVMAFEEAWSRWQNCKFTNMVNSGSSALLLAFNALCSKRFPSHLNSGDEVILPAVTWSTSWFPLYSVGLIPVFVDVDLSSLTIYPQEIRKAITPKTRAILAVHLLGSPCNMQEIKEICEDYNLILVEDCCEAHGAEFNRIKVGNFGTISTFSFMFAHHITTGEGGAICTMDEQLNDIILAQRAHGWIRDFKNENKRNEIFRKADTMDYRWTFWEKGFNLRMTELQAAIGIEQLKKLDNFILSRQENHKYLQNFFNQYPDWFITLTPNEKSILSPFAFSIIVTDNAPFKGRELKKFYEAHKIETRPIAGGNLTRHPCAKHLDYICRTKLDNSDYIHHNGFWIGNNPCLNQDNFDYVINVTESFLKKKI